MNKLGELIRKLRGKESLREASRRIGISHTYLDTIEKGFDKRSGKPVKPTPETIRLISNAYGYSYEKLMIKAGYIDRKDDREPTTQEKLNKALQLRDGENIYLYDMEGLTDDDIEMLKKQIELYREMSEKKKRDREK